MNKLNGFLYGLLSSASFGPLSCGGNKNGWILHQGKGPMLENSSVSFLIFFYKR